MEIEDHHLNSLAEHHLLWLVGAFYISLSITLALAVFSVVVPLYAVMKAQRMALHGNVDVDANLRDELAANLGYTPGAIGDGYPQGGPRSPERSGSERLRSLSEATLKMEGDDIQKSIIALRKVQPVVMVAVSVSLFAFVLAAMSMAWIKTCWHPKKHAPIIILMSLIVLFSLLLCASYVWIKRLTYVRQQTYHESTMLPPSRQTSGGAAHSRQTSTTAPAGGAAVSASATPSRTPLVSLSSGIHQTVAHLRGLTSGTARPAGAAPPEAQAAPTPYRSV